MSEDTKKEPNNSKPEEKAIEPEVVGEITKDDKLMATLAHILGLFTHVIAPLIIFLLKKDESDFIAENSKEALNFQISVLICWFIAGAASFIFVGIIFFPVILILDIVFCIQGAIAANDGKVYKYPVSFRFVK